MLLLYIAFPLVLLLLYISIFPYIQHLNYLLNTWRKKGKEGVNLGIPKTVFSFPFGIPVFLGLVKSVRSRTLFDYLRVRNMKANYKLTVREQMLGQFNITTQDPENIKALLSTQFKEFGFGRRYQAFYPLLGDGIFTLDGVGWKHSRAMLRPQFTREQISHMGTLETHMKKMLNILRGHETTPVDIQKLFFKLTIDTATEFLFGESVGSFDGGNPKIKNSHSFDVSFNKSLSYLADRVRANAFYNFFNSKEFQSWCKVCKDFTDSFVNLAIEKYEAQQRLGIDEKSITQFEKNTDKKKYVFLDELVKETRNPNVLRDQSLNILLAGRDTTASVLSWIFYSLAHHKDVFFKLRKIILDEFGTGDNSSPENSLDRITFESLKKCVYLRHVINETLRLYPVVPNNIRTALVDTTLPRGGGENEDKPIFVPKGTGVGYSVLLMQTNPLIWGPDASEFKPERWETQRNSNVLYTHPWDFLPFNGGPRICLGQQFALNEMSYAIVRILQNFQDIQPAISSVHLEAQLTLSVFEGVPVTLTPA